MLKTTCIIIAIVLLLLVTLWYLFPIVMVSGNSMHPTLQDSDFIIASRLFRKKLKVDYIYVFTDPNNSKRRVIKRLYAFEPSKEHEVRYFGKTKCYMLGDNPAESYDSRYYGFIAKKSIVARVLWYKKH